jgi:hypothetical protein
MQSSTVTRAIGSSLHMMELVLNLPASYPLANEISSFLSWFSRNRLLPDDCKTASRPIALDFIGTA